MPPHHAPKTALRVVSGNDCFDPRDPAQQLTYLFAQEAQLKRQLADVGRALEEARKHYAGVRRDGLTQPLPRMDLLRTRFGPPVQQ